MKIIDKLKGYILPKTIDFFGELTKQSRDTESIINELVHIYIKGEKVSTEKIFKLIDVTKKGRRNKLKQLEKVFITPVDREAISRSYSHLHWIVLSVKHLVVELETYEINNLVEYRIILEILNEQMHDLTTAFMLIKTKQYDKIFEKVNHIIHNDNMLISEYAKQLKLLFKKENMEYVLQRREILSQLKEISKRIHFCANQIEDIIFKMD